MTFAKRLRELKKESEACEDVEMRFEADYGKDPQPVMDYIGHVMNNAEAIAELAEEAERAAKLLDGIKYELYGSVYTVEDDEFDRIYFARDVLQQALKKLNGGAG